MEADCNFPKECRLRAAVLLFFAALLMLAPALYRDYGISWDEPLQRFTGAVTVRHLAERFMPSLVHSAASRLPDLDAYVDRDHGPAFEVPAVALEAMLGLKDKRDIYMFRHLLTFLVCYLGWMAIYRLAERRYSDWRIGLLATSFAVLTPRLFAESFYNSKDALFTAVFAIAMATTVSFILRPRPWTALVHAAATAIAIDIRLVAVILPAASLAVLAMRSIKQEMPARTALRASAVYLLVTCLLVVALWPWLWSDPVGHLLEAFANMKRFRWEGEILYLGTFVRGTELPWHYVPVWMAVTIPPLYLALFLVGLGGIVRRLLRSGLRLWRSEAELQDLFFVGLLFCPLVAVVALHSVLYGGWRHLYFVYPAFLLIAVGGWTLLWRATWAPRFCRPALALVTIVACLHTAVWMWRAHPLENVYFNRLAGGDIRHRFDYDYWGLANRMALEYILAHDPSPQITVRAASETPLEAAADMIATADRQRLKIVDDGKPARYLINNYYTMKETDPAKYAPGYAVFHQLDVDDEIVLTILKSGGD
jgi:hypothetical protein